MEEFEEIYSKYINLHLNSYYKDPAYQMAKMKYFEALLKVNNNLRNTNFIFMNGYDVVDNSTVLKYGTMKCDAPGKEAFMDSWLSCALFQLPFWLENLQFGYICLALTIKIMLISLFGGIKESYRWYILNQAIWDMLISYDFICEKPTLSGWHSVNWEKENTCFFNVNVKENIFYYIIGSVQDLVRYAFFIPLFLLAFSRFFGIYFPLFYKRIFSKNAKNIVFILIINAFFIVLISLRRVMLALMAPLTDTYKQDCKNRYCAEYNMSFSLCLQNDKNFFQCNNNADMIWPTWLKITKYIPYITTPLMFFCAIFFAALLFAKIIQQLKYQLKHNRTTFISTIKIAAVIIFQCVTMSFIFFMTAFQMYFYYFATKYEQMFVTTQYIYNNIPPLLLLFQYPATISSFNILRIFIDSLIILIVLNVYSSCVFGTIKWLFLCLKKPKNAFHKITVKFGKSNGNLFSKSSAKK